MQTRWEYLTIFYEHAARKVDDSWTYESTFYVRQPGHAEAEPRRDADSHTLFNELGAEGWELVLSNTIKSTLLAHSQGYDEVSLPISKSYIFKRPAGIGTRP